MEQVVIFHTRNDYPMLQKDVNAWLAENADKLEVSRVLQTQSGRIDTYITISIWYKTK